MSDTGFVYALKDPLTNEIKYIGKTCNKLKKRLYYHLYEIKKYNNKKTCWIKSLLNKKLIPIIELIEEVPLDILNEKEIYYIKYYKDLGYDLKNMTEGGDGQSKGYVIKHRYSSPKGILPKSLEPFRGKAAKGSKRTPEQILRQSLRTKGRIIIKARKNVYVLDLISKKEYYFKGQREAAKFLGLRVSCITNILKGRTVSHKNFTFKTNKEDVYPTYKITDRKKKIIAINECAILEFESTLDAHKNGYDRWGIWKCLTGKQKIYKGLQWQTLD